MGSDLQRLMEGKRIILNDHVLADVDRNIYWQTHGEWLQFDAPWEGSDEYLTPEEESIRTNFMKHCQVEKPTHRTGTAIVLKQGLRFLGWVNCYVKEGH
jgi:hypothetical protein